MTHPKKGHEQHFTAAGVVRRVSDSGSPRFPVLFQNGMKESGEMQSEILLAHVCKCLKKSISALLPREITLWNLTLPWVAADFTCSP